MKEVKFLIKEYQSAPGEVTIEKVKDAINYVQDHMQFNGVSGQELEELAGLECELEEILEELMEVEDERLILELDEQVF